MPRNSKDNGFDWSIYSNATLAGLAVLIPIPLVDWLFEEWFRRGIPRAIARRRGQRLAPEVIAALNRSHDTFLTSCLVLPFRLLFELVKRLSWKLLYFLSVKESSDKVARYWHQAFLIDYMLRMGHLANPDSAQAARQAMDQTLLGITTSPLHRLAQDIVRGSRHIFRTLLRARRGVEDEQIAQKKARLIRTWSDFNDELQALALVYDRHYQSFRQSEISREIERH